MIKFDFDSVVSVEKEKFNELMNKKDEVYSKFNSAYMTGWTKRISNEKLESIINVSNDVKRHSDCLVVIGIGGSFLGSYAVK